MIVIFNNDNKKVELYSLDLINLVLCYVCIVYKI